MLDDQPCELRTRTGTLYTIPYTVELNDIPMMMIQHHKASELLDRTMDQFERLYAEGAENARVMAIAVHPYITGVPHRIAYYEEILERLAGRPGVVFWTGEQIWTGTKPRKRIERRQFDGTRDEEAPPAGRSRAEACILRQAATKHRNRRWNKNSSMRSPA